MAAGDTDRQVVIVTGAASGIGAATTAALTAAGTLVVAIDRDEPSAPAAKRIRMNVTEEQDWIKAAEQTLTQFGRIDGLVNCAGVIRMAPIITMALADFRLTLQVNVEGPFLAMKYVLPTMYRQGRGSVVNISSTAGIAGAAGASAYCASKGAVRLLSKAVALEALTGDTGVRVNSLHPGMTDTPMVKEIVSQLGGNAETEDEMRALQPSGDFVPTAAVVDAILFLLSDASRFINGTELVVDNGFTAQ
ncbi:MAG: SDR family NAD(P)-dependent oxidoreductase [Sphingomonadaceae bacterium]